MFGEAMSMREAILSGTYDFPPFEWDSVSDEAVAFVSALLKVRGPVGTCRAWNIRC
jgi:hypothetical protein